MKKNLLFVLIAGIPLKNVFVYALIAGNVINVNVPFLMQRLAVRNLIRSLLE